jgi:hypothetical protein
MNNFFDKIIYLNLSESIEKNDWCKSHLSELGINAERFEAVKGSDLNIESELIAGDIGLNQSWINAIDQAIENNYKNFLLFEDDVLLTSDSMTVFSEAIAVDKVKVDIVDDLEKPIYSFDIMTGEQGTDIVGYEKKNVESLISDLPENWDVLYLGCRNTTATALISGRIHKVRSAVLAHAVAISEKMYLPLKTMLQEFKQPIDVCISLLIEDVETYSAYCFKTGIASQLGGFSDRLGINVQSKEVD